MSNNAESDSGYETIIKGIKDRFEEKEPSYTFIREDIEALVKAILVEEESLNDALAIFKSEVGTHFEAKSATNERRVGAFSKQINYLLTHPDRPTTHPEHLANQDQIAKLISSFVRQREDTAAGLLSKIKKEGGPCSHKKYMEYLFAIMVAGINPQLLKLGRPLEEEENEELEQEKVNVVIILGVLVGALSLLLLWSLLGDRQNSDYSLDRMLKEERNKSTVLSYFLADDELEINDTLGPLAYNIYANLNLWTREGSVLYEIATSKKEELPKDTLNTFPVGQGALIEVAMIHEGRVILFDHSVNTAFGIDYTKSSVAAIKPQPEVEWFDLEGEDRFKKFTLCYSPLKRNFGICINLEPEGPNNGMGAATPEEILLLLRPVIVGIAERETLNSVMDQDIVSFIRYRKTVSKEEYEELTYR